ncbi:MFS transporter [Vagococcus sp. BWB3-3]|uniref:MFS transporter n=1 Tax=Vagococcus allomyrinae TaxID=2794353 RepID=A0A940SVU5_9ENTE|nr:MFS transporter [Vagococcus allomyrinae]MBP1042254.1 MFS transporter [Vagococcus allomyrinae]
MKSVKIKIAILSQSFIIMGILVASTVLANIAEEFPNASLTGIQLIMTFGMVASFPCSLLAGSLGNKFSKKNISLIGILLMLTGGLLPLVFNQRIIFLYVSSLLIGSGQGLLMTTVSNLTTALFKDEERSQMYGLQASFQNGGSVVLMMVAGIAARVKWSNAYLAFLIVIPVLLVVWLWLPQEQPLEQENEVGNSQEDSRSPYSVLLIGVLICLFCIGYATFSLNISLYLATMNLGDSALAALSMSFSTGAGVIGGMLFPIIFKRMKRFVFVLSCGLTAIGYLSLVLFPNLMTTFLAAILSGIGFSTAVPLGTQAISETATASQMSASMGSFMAFTSIGAAVSPIVINALANVLPTQSNGTVFFTSSLFLGIVMIFGIVWAIRTSKSQVGQNQEKFE